MIAARSTFYIFNEKSEGKKKNFWWDLYYQCIKVIHKEESGHKLF